MAVRLWRTRRARARRVRLRCSRPAERRPRRRGRSAAEAHGDTDDGPAASTPAVPAAAPHPTAKQVGDGLYALLTFACTFFPAIGHQLAPGGEVGDRQDAFLAIYFATFPLSLAATFTFLTFFMSWFDDDKERLLAAGAAIVVSAVWGIGFGQSYAELETISQLRGSVPAVAAQIVVLALGAYAIFYGWALFIAGILSSLFAALWLKEKVDKLA